MTHALANRSRYIPWLFVAGFAVVIAVNATMIWFAVGSFSGLYTPAPRDRGLHYNAIMAEQKARDALGWRVEAAWQPEDGRLEVAVFDAAGQPLAGARIDRRADPAGREAAAAGGRAGRHRSRAGSPAPSTCRNAATGISTSSSSRAAIAMR